MDRPPGHAQVYPDFEMLFTLDKLDVMSPRAKTWIIIEVHARQLHGVGASVVKLYNDIAKTLGVA